jgi:hypothetical protein
VFVIFRENFLGEAIWLKYSKGLWRDPLDNSLTEGILDKIIFTSRIAESLATKDDIFFYFIFKYDIINILLT